MEKLAAIRGHIYPKPVSLTSRTDSLFEPDEVDCTATAGPAASTTAARSPSSACR